MNRDKNEHPNNPSLLSGEVSVNVAATAEALVGARGRTNARLMDAQRTAQLATTRSMVPPGLWSKALKEVREGVRQLHGAAKRMRATVVEAQRLERMVGELTSRLASVRDEERQRLARFLHDSAQQHMSGVAINLEVIARRARHFGPEARQALEDSRKLINRSLREARTYVFLLRPPKIDKTDPCASMRAYVAGFAARSGIGVDLDCHHLGHLTQLASNAVFHLVQESLTGLLGSQGSGGATIRLHTVSNTIRLDVVYGVRPAQQAMRGAPAGQQRSARGLEGLREQIRQVGGALTSTVTSRGFTVSALIPLRGEFSKMASRNIGQD
jgi:signal transduction histidine kinase